MFKRKIAAFAVSLLLSVGVVTASSLVSADASGTNEGPCITAVLVDDPSVTSQRGNCTVPADEVVAGDDSQAPAAGAPAVEETGTSVAYVQIRIYPDRTKPTPPSWELTVRNMETGAVVSSGPVVLSTSGGVSNLLVEEKRVPVSNVADRPASYEVTVSVNGVDYVKQIAGSEFGLETSTSRSADWQFFSSFYVATQKFQ